MKRYISVLICMVLSLIICSCAMSEDSAAARKGNYSQTTVDYVLNEKMAEEDRESIPEPSPSPEVIIPEPTVSILEAEREAMTHDGIDVDLTVLSSSMVYAEVYNMMTVPNEYVGKTVKMQGIYDTMYDESTGKQYYFCIIQDATACCAQGIEFVLEDESTYPMSQETVTVIGRFETYMEGENMYCTLKDAKLM